MSKVNRCRSFQKAAAMPEERTSRGGTFVAWSIGGHSVNGGDQGASPAFSSNALHCASGIDSSLGAMWIMSSALSCPGVVQSGEDAEEFNSAGGGRAGWCCVCASTC